MSQLLLTGHSTILRSLFAKIRVGECYGDFSLIASPVILAVIRELPSSNHLAELIQILCAMSPGSAPHERQAILRIDLNTTTQWLWPMPPIS
jgi:hypothetical protein